ncbi:hypothetical protein HZH66_005130 [Vespula vulgaris]|uniref:Uncharacterized protein n=1 Tax=Vespula vulgaris TaxID=7454 RepID=A0A834K9Z0_VESVU|nr:hypothetical protein HZH66_005130 [Vespula vulgaris]
MLLVVVVEQAGKHLDFSSSVGEFHSNAGCLTESASELDLAWSGYVETVERLVVAVDGRNDPLGLNAERAVRQLDTRISDAIMHAMGNSRALEEKSVREDRNEGS